MSDRVLGGFGLALAAFYVWGATLIPVSFITDPLGAKAFPFILAGAMAVTSLVLILRPDPEPMWPSARTAIELVFAIAVMFAYAMVLPEIGFVISSAIAAIYFCWRLGAPPLSALLGGIGISVGIYVLFNLVLGLSLARGPFGF